MKWQKHTPALQSVVLASAQVFVEKYEKQCRRLSGGNLKKTKKNDWYTMLFAIICLHLCSFLLPRAKEENICIIFIIIIIIRVLRWLRRGAIAIWWLFEAWKRKLGQRKNVEREAFPRDTQRVFGFTGFILAAVWSRRFQVVGIQARKRVAQIVSGRRRLSI